MNIKSISITLMAALLATACKTGDICDTYYRDRDGDGFGNADNSRFSCGIPRGFTTNDRDCDDRDDTNTPTGTYEGNLVIDGKDEGDLQAFLDACPGTMAGNITILNTDRTNVSILRSLENVQGTLTIANNEELADLSGLQNLTDAGGLVLSIIPGLRDLEDLDALERVESLRLNLRLTADENSLEVLGDIEGIQDLALNVVGVSNYAGLPELTTLERDLLLGGPTIMSFEGVDTITSIGGNFIITNFRNDVDFEALAVNRVGGQLVVSDNDGAVTVSLPNITSTGAIDVRNNASVTTLNLPACTTTGDVEFNSNTVLDSITTAVTEATSFNFTNLPALVTPQGFDGVDNASIEELTVLNTAFTSLTGLEGVAAVTGSVLIAGNTDLGSFTGLDNLASVGGQFEVVNNQGLSNLMGLGALESVNVSLILTTNSTMTSLMGADAVTTLGRLQVNDNNALGSFDNLATLTTVDTITVEENSLLNSIEGLNGVSGAKTATFRNNPNLSSADVDAWRDLVGAGNIGTFINEGNAP
ncbi:MAG: hypothetical protein AAGA48_22720 [Myxococcota bacterium]